MVVEPETFAMHMDIVREHFDVLPLREWIERKQNGQTLPAKCCAITFDDGWLDNYEYAYPLLRDKQIPATVFVVSHMIGTGRRFWPNRIAHHLAFNPESLHVHKSFAPVIAKIAEQDKGREFLAALTSALKQFSDEEIDLWLDELSPDLELDANLMNWEQLKEMMASGLIDIGSHTCNHYRLRNDLDPQRIRSEIEDSKKKIEEEIGEPPTLFCYPNGDLCDLARKSVGSNYQAAVTTRRGINSASELKLYELLRIGVHEDRCNTEAKFCSRLANWY